MARLATFRSTVTSPAIYAVIMAGGAGTRFWPASRRERPKQFLPVSGARPMIAETFQRLEGLVPHENVLVVTAATQAELVVEALPELPRENVLAEPSARNTAACLGLAALEIERRDPDAVQLVLPADHVIDPVSAFQASVRAAVAEAAAGDVLVIFGIRPDHPATGYGYIEGGEVLGEQAGIPVHRVVRFVEKPDRATAEGFLAAGTFLWNSGMFVWRTETILRAFREHLPVVPDELGKVGSDSDLGRAYGRLPAVPVDKAILERASNVRVLPIDYRWSDVGSWSALADILSADEAGNVSSLSGGATLVLEDAEGCLAYAESDEVVALLGVRDLVVVRAKNATLVCPRSRAEEVRRVVDRLEGGNARFL